MKRNLFVLTLLCFSIFGKAQSINDLANNQDTSIAVSLSQDSLRLDSLKQLLIVKEQEVALIKRQIDSLSFREIVLVSPPKDTIIRDTLVNLTVEKDTLPLYYVSKCYMADDTVYIVNQVFNLKGKTLIFTGGISFINKNKNTEQVLFNKLNVLITQNQETIIIKKWIDKKKLKLSAGDPGTVDIFIKNGLKTYSPSRKLEHPDWKKIRQFCVNK